MSGFGFGFGFSPLGALLNQNEPELPADYWQENDTENYFVEEETNIILTLEDL